MGSNSKHEEDSKSLLPNRTTDAIKNDGVAVANKEEKLKSNGEKLANINQMKVNQKFNLNIKPDNNEPFENPKASETKQEMKLTNITTTTSQKPPKVELKSVNANITCHLCNGYLIDATTIVECLHSFCHSCLMKHLRNEQYCPRCEMMINKAKPNIKPDATLQAIVYKLVPGLYEKELLRKRAFYKLRPDEALLATPEQRGDDTEHLIFGPTEKISLSLEYCDDEEIDNHSDITSHVKRAKYLFCPALFSVALLKKLILYKFDINSNRFCVEIMYKVKTIVLPDHYTLMDVAYIYTWKRDAPMRFFFRVRTNKCQTEEVPEIAFRRSPSVSSPQTIIPTINRIIEPDIVNVSTSNKCPMDSSDRIPIPTTEFPENAEPQVNYLTSVLNEKSIGNNDNICEQTNDAKGSSTSNLTPRDEKDENINKETFSRVDPVYVQDADELQLRELQDKSNLDNKIETPEIGKVEEKIPEIRVKKNLYNNTAKNHNSSKISSKKIEQSVPVCERRVENIKLKIDLSKKNSVTIIKNNSNNDNHNNTKNKSIEYNDTKRKHKIKVKKLPEMKQLKVNNMFKAIQPNEMKTDLAINDNAPISKQVMSNTEAIDEKKSEFLNSFQLTPIKNKSPEKVPQNTDHCNFKTPIVPSAAKVSNKRKNRDPVKNVSKKSRIDKDSTNSALNETISFNLSPFPIGSTIKDTKRSPPIKTPPSEKEIHDRGTNEMDSVHIGIDERNETGTVLTPQSEAEHPKTKSPTILESTKPALKPLIHAQPKQFKRISPKQTESASPIVVNNIQRPTQPNTPRPPSTMNLKSNKLSLPKLQPKPGPVSASKSYADVAYLNNTFKYSGTEFKDITKDISGKDIKVYGPQMTPMADCRSQLFVPPYFSPIQSKSVNCTSSDFRNYALINNTYKYNQQSANTDTQIGQSPAYNPISPIYSPCSPQYTPNYNISTQPQYKYMKSPAYVSNFYHGADDKSKNAHSNCNSQNKRICSDVITASNSHPRPLKQMKSVVDQSLGNIKLPSALSVTMHTNTADDPTLKNPIFNQGPVNNYIEIVALDSNGPTTISKAISTNSLSTSSNNQASSKNSISNKEDSLKQVLDELSQRAIAAGLKQRPTNTITSNTPLKQQSSQSSNPCPNTDTSAKCSTDIQKQDIATVTEKQSQEAVSGNENVSKHLETTKSNSDSKTKTDRPTFQEKFLQSILEKSILDQEDSLALKTASKPQSNDSKMTTTPLQKETQIEAKSQNLSTKKESDQSKCATSIVNNKLLSKSNPSKIDSPLLPEITIITNVVSRHNTPEDSLLTDDTTFPVIKQEPIDPELRTSAAHENFNKPVKSEPVLDLSTYLHSSKSEYSKDNSKNKHNAQLVRKKSPTSPTSPTCIQQTKPIHSEISNATPSSQQYSAAAALYANAMACAQHNQNLFMAAGYPPLSVEQMQQFQRMAAVDVATAAAAAAAASSNPFWFERIMRMQKAGQIELEKYIQKLPHGASGTNNDNINNK